MRVRFFFIRLHKSCFFAFFAFVKPNQKLKKNAYRNILLQKPIIENDMEKYAMLTDDQLVGLYKEGDNKAFDVLLERNQDRIFQYIYIMSNGDENAANDAFQDTFVRAIVAIREGRYQANGQFCAWLMRIARNIVLDAVRSRRTHRTIRQEITNEDGSMVGDILNDASLSEPDAEMQIVFSQSLDDVRMMIDLLPEAQREVVVMRFYQELSFKEIAELTNVSINTALGRMRYAMINLKRMAQRRNLYLVG